MAVFEIGNQKTGDDHPPIVCAEIGANHDGNLEKAILMIEKIAKSGIKLVKFQFYSTEELVSDPERIVKWGPKSKIKEEPVGKMFERLTLPGEIVKELFLHAKKLNLEPFATPFSKQGVDFLMSLDISCFKIAASDVTYLTLLEYVAQTKKPVILSLGKCSLAEADIAINCLKKHDCGPLALIHCVAAYPSPIEEMNLRVIPTLAHLYPECVIGLSDHSLGTVASIASVALGAKLIERHVTLSRSLEGPDHWFSLEIEELQQLQLDIHAAYDALGHPRKQVLTCEKEGREKAMRSLVAARNLSAGNVITSSDLKAVRPGTGISPTFFHIVEGLKIQQDIKKNTILTWNHFKEDKNGQR